MEGKKRNNNKAKKVFGGIKNKKTLFIYEKKMFCLLVIELGEEEGQQGSGKAHKTKKQSFSLSKL